MVYVADSSDNHNLLLGSKETSWITWTADEKFQVYYRLFDMRTCNGESNGTEPPRLLLTLNLSIFFILVVAIHFAM